MKTQNKLIKTIALALTLATTASVLPSQNAQAFAEDICYPYESLVRTELGDPIEATPINCFDLNGDDHDHDEGDFVTGMFTFAAAAYAGKYHARSVYHFDVPYLMARLSGMSHKDAVQLAVYSEATDLGQFMHYDYQGRALPATLTDDISGVERTNADTFGGWLHYVPWYQNTDAKSQNKLTYDKRSHAKSPFNVHEAGLNHLRAWAFGQRDTLCLTGLTNPDGSCFDADQDVQLFISLPALGPVLTEGAIDVQDQSVLQVSEGEYDTDYNSEISGSLKSLGIYLHAMSDRLSHNFCTDPAYVAPSADETSAEEFELYYPQACGTVIHVMRHYDESGMGFVPPRSESAVQYTLWEIRDFMKKTGYRAKKKIAFDETAVLEQVYAAIGEETATERLSALCQIAKDNGIEWHDGNATCTY